MALVCKEATDDLGCFIRRCRTVLGNMAAENPGLWNEADRGRRWTDQPRGRCARMPGTSFR